MGRNPAWISASSFGVQWFPSHEETIENSFCSRIQLKRFVYSRKISVCHLTGWMLTNTTFSGKQCADFFSLKKKNNTHCLANYRLFFADSSRSACANLDSNTSGLIIPFYFIQIIRFSCFSSLSYEQKVFPCTNYSVAVIWNWNWRFFFVCF